MLISAIMPLYNVDASRQIDSILRAPAILEIILIDDHSAIPVVSSDPRVVVVRNERNLGVNASVTKGVALAQGEGIYLGAGDDFAHPDLFSHASALLDEHPQAPAFFSMQSWFTNFGHAISGRPLMYPHRGYLSPEQLAGCIRNTDLATTGAVYRKARYLELDHARFDSELKWNSDWFVNLVLAFRHGIVWQPQQLSSIRIHDGQGTVGMRDEVQQRAVFGNVVRLLDTDYRDVRDFFYTSGAFEFMFPRFLPEYLHGLHEAQISQGTPDPIPDRAASPALADAVGA